MAVPGGPNIVTSGLVLELDAANVKSYPGSGTVWNDLSGNNYSGSLVGSPTFNSANGGSIVFDGTDDYVSTPTTGSVYSFPNTTFTVSTWVKTTSTPGILTFFITKDLAGTGLGWGTGMSIPGQNSATEYGFLVFTKGSGGGVSLLSSTNQKINDGIWHHLTAVITTNTSTIPGNSALLYIDAEVKSFNSQTAVTPYIAPTLPLEIGRRSTGNYFDGNISLIQIYNRALTAAEILQNYNAQKSRFSL
jgi:hypothetical protein